MLRGVLARALGTELTASPPAAARLRLIALATHPDFNAAFRHAERNFREMFEALALVWKAMGVTGMVHHA